MKMDEFMRKVLEVIPTAEFGEDNDGQIVVYTNLIEWQGGEVVPLDDLT